MSDEETTEQATEETVAPAEADADATRAKIAAQGTEAEEPQTPPDEEPVVDEAQVAAEVEPTDTPPIEEEVAEEPPPKKKTSGYSRLKVRHQGALAENEQLRREIEELKAEGDADPEPKLEDFNDDYDAYQRALTAHDVRQAVREETSKNQKAEAERREKEAGQLAEDEFMERLDEARGQIADYDQALISLQSSVGELNKDLVGLLQDSDKGELILYHLGKNPTKGARLNSMGIIEASREIGRLEATLSVPKPNKQTKAPPPVEPVKGGSAPPQTDLSKIAKSDDMDAYIAARKAQTG